jgi:sulfite exporter TauE/SafE
MDSHILVLASAAASIGLLHTALGPDHYIPFIALAKSQNWSKIKTVWITTISGIGHVLSSVLIGMFGYLLGSSILSLGSLENIRGGIAGWSLLILGLLYTIWGIKKSQSSNTHSHIHFHADGIEHSHTHTHKNAEHKHIHETKEKSKATPWVLFLIFLFGPCEPLIPLLIYPAAGHNIFAVVFISTIFGIVTIGTMLGIVFLGLYGISFIPMKKIEKHIHTLAGLSILFSGIAVQFLGL